MTLPASDGERLLLLGRCPSGAGWSAGLVEVVVGAPLRLVARFQVLGGGLPRQESLRWCPGEGWRLRLPSSPLRETAAGPLSSVLGEVPGLPPGDLLHLSAMLADGDAVVALVDVLEL